MRGLAKNRSAARETTPIKPIADEFVDKTIPFPPNVCRGHLPSLRQPMLFLSGTRDELADRDLLEQVVSNLPTAQLHWLDTANHAYHVLKRTRQSTEDIFEEMARVARGFIARVTSPHRHRAQAQALRSHQAGIARAH